MGRTTLDCPLWPLPCQETVNQAGSKGISPAYSVEDLKVLANWRLMELTIEVTDCAPIINGCSLSMPQGRGHHLEIRKFSHRPLNHAVKILDIPFRKVLVQSLDF
jgi:hypothetical protein